MKKLFTSESVCEGHPDKLCDFISDSILDAYLKEDQNARVACEVTAGKDMIFITGEISSTASIDIEKVCRNCIQTIGYFGDCDIHYDTCKVLINVSKQSPDIERGTNDIVGGAGDQGMMFGYATDETPSYLPFGVYYAHQLAKRIQECRKNHMIDGIGADGKVQITVEYDQDQLIRIDTILISIQHRTEIDLESLKEKVWNCVVIPTIPNQYLDSSTHFYFNPTGRFVIGGPLGDAGVTGRKIIVDTYGGYARHGGGAFSGKDGTKVDRSAAYMARFVAKNVVANHYAKRCEIQLSYAIGMKDPISIYLNTYGTNTISEEELLKKIQNTFDFTPQGMIQTLHLQEPIFTKTTNYGHFGKDDLPWENIISF